MQVTSQSIVDMLDATLQPVAGGADGDTGTAISVEIGFYTSINGYNDTIAPGAPFVESGQQGTAFLAGTATKCGVAVPFAGRVQITSALVTALNPIDQLGRMAGANCDLTFTSSSGGLELRVDPSHWFDQANFCNLATPPPRPAATDGGVADAGAADAAGADGGSTAQAGGGLGARSLIGHLTLARTFLDESLSAGIGLRLGGLNVFTLTGSNQLFTQAGLSGEGGVVWLPKGERFRLAFSGGLPIYTGAMQFTNCDPNDCYGYILPNEAIGPWIATLGGAFQFAHSAWNERVNQTYRDERQLTVAVDLSFTGAVPNGYGLEAFAAQQLQQSGRSTTVTPRFGAESEAIPGWLRLRAGTYLEPTRVPETDARWHATGGFEVRIVAFHLLRQERRVQVSGVADVASRFQNVAVSIGFWD